MPEINSPAPSRWATAGRIVVLCSKILIPIARAQFYLGLMYRNGRGVPKDDAQAAKWYLKAAQSGNRTAEYNLALIYDDPKSTVCNQKQALVWYQDGAKNGDARAQVNLGRATPRVNSISAWNSPTDSECQKILYKRISGPR